MQNITFRPVQTSDAPFLTRLMNHPVLLQRLHQYPTTLFDWEEAIALWLRDPDEQGYILFAGQTPIGWFAFNALEQPIPYLKIAALLPDFQGQGIASQVLPELFQSLKLAGYSSVRLFVDCDNVPALACYRKCGFHTISAAVQDWPDGSITTQYEKEKQL